MTKGISQDILRKIAQSFCSGEADLKQLADKFGVSHGTLKNYSYRLGWGSRKRENLARAINPPVGDIDTVRTNVEKLFAHQSQFLLETPAQFRKATAAALRMAKKAEREGNLKDSGYLLKIFSDISATARTILGLKLQEDLELEKARSVNRKKQNEEAQIVNPIPPEPISVKHPVGGAAEMTTGDLA